MSRLMDLMDEWLGIAKAVDPFPTTGRINNFKLKREKKRRPNMCADCVYRVTSDGMYFCRYFHRRLIDTTGACSGAFHYEPK